MPDGFSSLNSRPELLHFDSFKEFRYVSRGYNRRYASGRIRHLVSCVIVIEKDTRVSVFLKSGHAVAVDTD